MTYRFKDVRKVPHTIKKDDGLPKTEMGTTVLGIEVYTYGPTHVYDVATGKDFQYGWVEIYAPISLSPIKITNHPEVDEQKVSTHYETVLYNSKTRNTAYIDWYDHHPFYSNGECFAIKGGMFGHAGPFTRFLKEHGFTAERYSGKTYICHPELDKEFRQEMKEIRKKREKNVVDVAKEIIEKETGYKPLAQRKIVEFFK